MTATSCVAWIVFLPSRVVFVKRGRGIRHTSALFDDLKEDCFIPLEETDSSGNNKSIHDGDYATSDNPTPKEPDISNGTSSDAN